MRASVVLSSVSSQTLSAVAAMTPGALATPVGMAFVTLNVLASIRASEDVPQTGAHKLPKPEAIPPQGLAMAAIGSPFLFVLGSILSSASLPGAKTAAEKKIHSGLPVASNSASAFRFANGICTPGVLTPTFGAAGLFPCADLGVLSAAAASERRSAKLIGIRIGDSHR